MVDLVLKSLRKLGLGDFCEPDSETLTSNTDNQLAKRIQTKNNRGLGQSTSNIKQFLDSSKSSVHYEGKYKFNHNSKTKNRTKKSIAQLLG